MFAVFMGCFSVHKRNEQKSEELLESWLLEGLSLEAQKGWEGVILRKGWKGTFG